MQSELRKEIKNQDIKLYFRKKLEVSGVKKLISLNENEFIVDTSLGILQITGENISMNQLELEKGFLELNGTINKLEYIEDIKKEKKSIFGKLFK